MRNGGVELGNGLVVGLVLGQYKCGFLLLGL